MLQNFLSFVCLMCLFGGAVISGILFTNPQPVNDGYQPSSLDILFDWPQILLQLGEVHQITNGSRSVTVAVIDSGIDLRYPELNDVLWRNRGEIPQNGIDDDLNGYIDDNIGWDFVNNDNDPSDDAYHGTFVTSLITGMDRSTRDFYNRQITGVSPNITVMPIKYLNSDVKGVGVERFVQSVRYAVDNGADIINLSLFWEELPNEVEEVLLWAEGQGVLLVGITGNMGEVRDGINVLGSLSSVLAVGSVGQDLKRSTFSQYGEGVELVAPGEFITGAFLVNSVLGSELVLDGQQIPTNVLNYSSSLERPISAPLVYAGLGRAEDYSNLETSGGIVLVDRGELFFRDKVSQAALNGATGVVIANNQPGNFLGTLLEPVSIPAVSISLEDGLFLKNKLEEGPQEITFDVRYVNTSITNGTSFAAPFVSGAAALLLSVDPSLSSSSVRNILIDSATDIGPIGWDPDSGYGLVNITAALNAVSSNTSKQSSACSQMLAGTWHAGRVMDDGLMRSILEESHLKAVKEISLIRELRERKFGSIKASYY